MKSAPIFAIHASRVVTSASAHVDVARSLANGLPKIHGESRAQVLESGGRVDKGVTTKRGVSVGTGDSGRESRTTPAVFLGQIAGDLS